MGLRVAKITADGNCLFRAVGDQLEVCKADQLRAWCVGSASVSRRLDSLQSTQLQASKSSFAASRQARIFTFVAMPTLQLPGR